MPIKIHSKVAPSATVRINTLALEKKAAGIEVFNFAAGDPVVPHFPDFLQALKKGGSVAYPPLLGFPRLRELASLWLNEEYGCQYTGGNTLVTCGGKFAIYAAIQVLTAPGDEVLVVAPYWTSYPDMVKLCGACPKIISTDLENGWKLTPALLEKNISKNTRAFLFNNGCNPTGALYSHEEVQKILEVAERHDLAVISDEVYSEVVYDGKKYTSCGAFPSFSDRVVVIQSGSKNFAMAGLRVGFAFGPVPLIQAMASLQGQTTTGTSSISQEIAIWALENRRAITHLVRETMQKGRDHFYSLFNQLFSCSLEKPHAAIYAWIPLDIFSAENTSSVAFCEQILLECHVAAVPGVAFGKEGFFRMAYSTTVEQIEKGLRSLQRMKP